MDQVAIVSDEGVRLLPLVAGAVLLLGGWVIYWFSLNAAGAVAAGGLALLVAELILPFTGLGEGESLAIAATAATVGAIAGIVTVRAFHRTAFFLIGFILGGVGWYLVVTRLHEAGVAVETTGRLTVSLGGALVAAVLGGLAAIVADRAAIALATAVAGAALLMVGVEWRWGTWPLVPLAVIGFLFQMGAGRRKKADKDEDEKKE